MAAGTDIKFHPILSRIFRDIATRRTQESRKYLAKEIRDYVIIQTQKMPKEQFTVFMTDLNKVLADLARGSDRNERLCALAVIDSLTDILEEDNATKIPRINYLRLFLNGNDIVVVKKAAKVLGHLAGINDPLTTNVLDFYMRNALENIEGGKGDTGRRHSAILILKELATHAPTLFFTHVSEFINVIFYAVCDLKKEVRMDAVVAFRACMEVTSQRESVHRKNWHSQIYEQCKTNLRSSSPEAVHGSLLVLGELIKSGDFMESPRYEEACDEVFVLYNNRNSLILRTVAFLSPILANHNPEVFHNLYFDRNMVFLMRMVKVKEDKGIVIQAFGEMTRAMEDRIEKWLNQIIVVLNDVFTIKRGKYTSDEATYQAALGCISMIVMHIKNNLDSLVPQLLDPMFQRGLSSSLTRTLSDIASKVPSIRSSIEKRLLDMVSMILAKEPYRIPGAPRKIIPGQQEKISVPEHDFAILVLAVKTLGEFDFSEYNLSLFVNDIIINYLEDEKGTMRREAASTCAKILIKSFGKPEAIYYNNHYRAIVEKLVMVGITDIDSTVRSRILISLDSTFDKYLCLSENINAICKGLNDEAFEIRLLSVKILGRLTQLNPAYSVPPLRNVLLHLLIEIECSDVSKDVEESASLLAEVIQNSCLIMKPYVEAVVKALHSKIQDPNPAVATNVLASLGELGRVAGEEVKPYMDDLLPKIIETLYDQSSVAKREVALRTIGQLCQNTGLVIKPYLTHTKLLDVFLGFLKTERIPSVRKELIKVLGILGALDPYKYKLSQAPVREYEANVELSNSLADSMKDEAATMNPTQPNYYPTVAVNALVNLMADSSLSVHYPLIVQALDIMVRTLGEGFVPFLPKIVPTLLSRLKNAEPGLKGQLFQTLSRIVLTVKDHITKFVDEIMKIVIECWREDLFQVSVIPLIQSVAYVTGSDFRHFMPKVMPIILQVFASDISEDRLPTLQVLQTLEIFETNLNDYYHLVNTSIIMLIRSKHLASDIRVKVVYSLEVLISILDVTQYSSSIVHPLLRVTFETNNESLQNACLSALTVLVLRMGSDIDLYVPSISKLLTKNRMQNSKYEKLLSVIMTQKDVKSSNGDQPQQPRITTRTSAKKQFSDFQAIDTTKQYYCNQQKLRNAWEASQKSTKDDWIEWIRRLSTELLLESPSPALRACGELAKVYEPLSSELFNAAFLSCWNEIFETLQGELVASLKVALESSKTPPEITQTLLNLAEFMEHDDKRLPIDTKLLGQYARNCHAYAKELHYKELEFLTEPSSDCIESLISVNNKLKQPEAATGILAYAREHDKTMKIKESWYEKLERWNEALEAYEKRVLDNDTDFSCTLGSMRCLVALGRWKELHILCQEKWKGATDFMKREIAPMASSAAWGISDWYRMQQHVGFMQRTSPDGAFFRAILAINKNMFPLAQQYIDETRQLLDSELTALAGESYNRAYRVVVRVQMLAELEEIITYKKGTNEEKNFLRGVWAERLQGCQRNVEVWQRILIVRSLVVSPEEDSDIHLKFSTLCRKQHMMDVSYKTLVTLLGYDPKQSGTMDLPIDKPKVTFAYLKHIWGETHSIKDKNEALREKEKCLQQFGDFVKTLTRMPIATEENRDSRRHLLARCLLKLGKWKQSMHETPDDSVMKEVLKNYREATTYDRNWYKAWHMLALANFQTVAYHEKVRDPSNSRTNIDRLRAVVTRQCATAITAFFKSISLSQGHSLQDTLRLLTLWFKYGSYEEVGVAMNEGVRIASIDTWLQVIPQLIARIHTPSDPVRQLIHIILMKIGQHHPQALIYPLTVASKSQSQLRKEAALQLTEKIRANNNILVEQALLVSNELIRVAILWHEMWHEGLEDASRMWFGEENFDAMYRTLEPLHNMINKGPETSKEQQFVQMFGRDLVEAYNCTKLYSQNKSEKDLSKAWELYYSVFRRIAKQLHQLVTLDLNAVSPKLQNALSLDIAVPGTYRSNERVVRINSISPTLSVITSKQRPRKLAIKGSDGQDYNYLLKGHEDLRQDERVMQLFGLLNNLLTADPKTFKRHLHIQRYAVIPLSPKSGLIGWVPHCDTLHSLIKDYRELRKILLNIEQRIMLQMAPDYDSLTVPQKTEVFDHALDTTTGQDLYKVLWLRSRNSESWLDRRTNYTRSLAVMSMVGYVLGLGDRHPSNLMLDRFSGKILHIDFGDCFEVAMHREKFPEKVPFRLTRMLTKAMEVSGIEGNYRITCNQTMRVLRENKDSVMAVLEAFVYDPLINWRLMESSKKKNVMAGNDLADESGAYTAYRVRSKSVCEQSQDDLVDQQPEVSSQRAVSVINRVQAKLSGRDFKHTESLLVDTQVGCLIAQATSHENLCQLYVGWCPFW